MSGNSVCRDVSHEFLGYGTDYLYYTHSWFCVNRVLGALIMSKEYLGCFTQDFLVTSQELWTTGDLYIVQPAESAGRVVGQSSEVSYWPGCAWMG